MNANHRSHQLSYVLIPSFCTLDDDGDGDDGDDDDDDECTSVSVSVDMQQV